jgi:hypothetical protein
LHAAPKRVLYGTAAFPIGNGARLRARRMRHREETVS